MAYWIHEDGRTVGPLRAIEVLERAKPWTLVSHNQDWVRCDRHPDFAHLVDHATALVQPVGEPRDGLQNSAANSGHGRNDEGVLGKRDIEYWVLFPGRTSPKGPCSHEEIRGLEGPDFRVLCGEHWVRLEDHPDFSRLAAPESGSTRNTRSLIGPVKLTVPSTTVPSVRLY